MGIEVEYNVNENDPNDGLSVVDHSADVSTYNLMVFVMSIFFTASVLMRDTARLGRAAAREDIKIEMFASADLMEKAAHKNMLAGILSGGITIVGGLVGVGFAYKSSTVYDGNPKFEKGPEGDHARSVLNNKAASYNTYGQSFRELTSGIGGLTGAVLTGQAELTNADAQRIQAEATAMQEFVDNWNDLHGQATANVTRVLDAFKEYIAALHALSIAITDNQ